MRDEDYDGNWVCCWCLKDSKVSVHDDPPDGWDVVKSLCDDLDEEEYRDFLVCEECVWKSTKES